MCGIGGILGEPDQGVLSRMNYLMDHKGLTAKEYLQTIVDSHILD